MNPYDKRNLGFKIVQGVTSVALVGSGYGLAVLVTHLDKPKSITVTVYPKISITIPAQKPVVVTVPKALTPPSQPPQSAVTQAAPQPTTQNPPTTSGS